MMQILCRDPALGKLGTKLFDYTPLFNFPAPKLLRNPALGPTPLGMAEVNSSPAGRERGSVSPEGGSSFPPPKRATPSLLSHTGNTRSPQGQHPSSLYILEDTGVGEVYITRSLHQRALRVDPLFLNVMKNAPQQLPISFSVLL